MSTTYTIQTVVLGSDGSVLPLSVLDKHRLVSNPSQIGIRYWNEKWRDWSHEIIEIEDGVDVTKFISKKE